jgi:hypothetical protein
MSLSKPTPHEKTSLLTKSSVASLRLSASPALKDDEFYNLQVVNDLKTFKHQANIIIANRKAQALSDVTDKIYTRDLFGSD